MLDMCPAAFSTPEVMHQIKKQNKLFTKFTRKENESSFLNGVTLPMSGDCGSWVTEDMHFVNQFQDHDCTITPISRSSQHLPASNSTHMNATPPSTPPFSPIPICLSTPVPSSPVCFDFA
eukprot:c14196_g1_i1.p1 GENE.c14196_g1_i1~~c14196_g1_i1.p1  ORF type:complete len:120 (-),score=19.06 c14196_g1_i1:150-509(-)